MGAMAISTLAGSLLSFFKIEKKNMGLNFHISIDKLL